MTRYILRVIGNFIWKLFGGFIISGVWFAMGIVLSLTIVLFPIAVKCFKIGYFVWKPFGHRAVVNINRYLIFNFVWALTFGLYITIFALFNWFLSLFTIYGIFLSKQWVKVLKINLFPFGSMIK